MPKRIERSELGRLLEEGAQLVEVLPDEEYDFEHIPGAVNIPLNRLDREAPERLDHNKPVVVYCNDYL